MHSSLDQDAGRPRQAPIRRTNRLGEFLPDGTNQFVGVQIRTGRRLLGISRGGLAERLSTDAQIVAGYEHGSREIPAMTMARIAETLHMPLPWFYHRAPGCEPEQPAAAVATAAARAPDARLHVLVVDDAPDVLVILGAFLEGAGLQVTKARSGDEALRIVASDTVLDAIVTDSVMPGMTGADLLLQSAELRPSLPGLMVTGFPEDTRRLVDLPKSVEILRKPFRREDLVRRVLDMAKARRALDAAPTASPTVAQLRMPSN